MDEVELLQSPGGLTRTEESVETRPVDRTPDPDAGAAEVLVRNDHRSQDRSERALGDFTTTPAILRLVPLAILIGALGAGFSLALQLVSPDANTLGALALVTAAVDQHSLHGLGDAVPANLA